MINEPIITGILDLMYTTIIAEGGDGDSLWLSKYLTLIDLVSIIESYNDNNKIDWEILLKENYLLWGSNQEWAIITDDEDFYNSQQPGSLLKIVY